MEDRKAEIDQCHGKGRSRQSTAEMQGRLCRTSTRQEKTQALSQNNNLPICSQAMADDQDESHRKREGGRHRAICIGNAFGARGIFSIFGGSDDSSVPMAVLVGILAIHRRWRRRWPRPRPRYHHGGLFIICWLAAIVSRNAISVRVCSLTYIYSYIHIYFCIVAGHCCR